MKPLELLRPGRSIQGLTAVLLPFTEQGDIDWSSLRNLLKKTVDAGLTPAVNMDTGYGNWLEDAAKLQVLQMTREIVGGKDFVAGAFVADSPGSRWQREAYLKQLEMICRAGGIPVICQSFGLTELPEPELVAAYQELARHCQRFIAFELGSMFAPFGAIYSIPVYEQLLKIPNCIGAKHSSLDRQLEWERLRLRNRVRPEFHVYTGNDLAIDMVMFGSDYLLGLATFAPDVFARRDAAWAQGDAEFFQINDDLQYLGAFAFRDPVPAYKHSAAQFLYLRGWINYPATHPQCPRRPGSDVSILQTLGHRLGLW